LCSFVLFYFFPLMRQLQNNIWGTISRIGGWGMNIKIITTETSLHLNLEIFLKFYLFIIYFTLFYSFYVYFFCHLLIFSFYS
jgi:hypothetical protein